MDIDYQVGEVELSYKSTVREKRKIATSSDAYGMLLSTFREDTIGYKEYFTFCSSQEVSYSSSLYIYNASAGSCCVTKKKNWMR